VTDERQEEALESLRAQGSLPGLLHASTRSFVDVVDGTACAISRVVGDILIQVAEYALDGRTLAPVANFFALDEGFRGGLRIAAKRVDLVNSESELCGIACLF